MGITERIYPVKVLRAQGAVLQDALAQVLENSEPKQVHKLRTSVRRVEAELELLSRLGELPEHGAAEKKLRGCLRRLRRSAGAVRDCDAQMKLIEAHLAGGTRPELDREGKKLRKRLRADRDLYLEKLLTCVRRQEAKLEVRMEALLEELSPSEDLSLSAGEMATRLRQWVGDRVQKMDEAKGTAEEDHLHNIRKTAKLARYIAETAPEGSSRLRRLGKSYEALQQSGGTWHDWLTLWRIAKRHLGKGAPLTAHFKSEHEISLHVYQQALASSEMKG